MMRCLLLFCLAGGVLSDSVVINQAVDEMLAGIRQEVLAKGMDSIPIEEMSHTWKYKWHRLVHLSGKVNCRAGWVKSLGSLQRTGDVVLTTAGNTMSLKLAMGLGNLELGFDHCSFHAKHLFSLTQKISAKVHSNSVVAQVSVTRNGPQCSVALDSLSLENIGKITVKTGGGVIHKIEDKLLDWVAKHIHEKVVKNLSEHLQDLARSNISKTNLCDKLPH